MLNLRKGHYCVRQAFTDADRAASFALRAKCFRDGADDRDAWDVACNHFIVEHTPDQRIVATFRLLTLSSGAELFKSYAAQSYDLTGLQKYSGKLAELGRFCIAQDVVNPDVLRVVWGGITRFVDANGIEMLFGCSSFDGTDPQPFEDSFHVLADRHRAPACWAPLIRSKDVIRFADLNLAAPDRLAGLRQMPPLLKTYLGMGGWVSDHAVIDHDLGTLHVFTAVELATVPKARARALRAIVTNT